MNKKAEAFEAYLKEKDITCFSVDPINDELNTTVFRSHMDIEGQSLPTIVVLDSSIYGMIRVRIANQAIHEDNEYAVLKEINKVNRQYKVFKYYTADDGTLFLDSCFLNRNGVVDGDMIYTVLDVIIKHLQQEYKVLMKLIWQ